MLFSLPLQSPSILSKAPSYLVCPFIWPFFLHLWMLLLQFWFRLSTWLSVNQSISLSLSLYIYIYIYIYCIYLNDSRKRSHKFRVGETSIGCFSEWRPPAHWEKTVFPLWIILNYISTTFHRELKRGQKISGKKTKKERAWSQRWGKRVANERSNSASEKKE